MRSNLSHAALVLAMLMGSQPDFAGQDGAESGAAGETIVITGIRVALGQANKRAVKSNARVLVYQLTLCTSREAFFGQGGNSQEYELLLPPGLSVSATAF